MTAPELWHLLIHTPGPKADPAVPITEAPWFPQHRKLHIRLAEAGYLIAAGPLPGRPGAGQTLVRGATLDELTWLATEVDRAVAAGFLEVEIVPWTIVDSIFDFSEDDDDDDDRDHDRDHDGDHDGDHDHDHDADDPAAARDAHDGPA